MKLRNFFLFLFLITAMQTISAQTVDLERKYLKFKHYSLTEGLSQSSVLCILQDSKGFLWFGTRDGLNKYDGHVFKTYRHNSLDQYTISNSYIKTLVEDEQGMLWAGTFNGLNKYLPNEDRFMPIELGLEDDSEVNTEIWSIIPDGNGHLWLGTNLGLIKYDTLTGESDLYSNHGEDHTGTVKNKIRSILLKADNELWICNTSNIQVFNPHTNSLKHYYYPQYSDDKIQSKYAPVLFQDQNQNIWLGHRQGLAVFNEKLDSFEPFVSENSKIQQITDEVRSVEQDYLGNLWVGTYNGLYLLDKNLRTISHFEHDENDPASLSHNSIYTILEDSKGDLWIGTYAGGVNYFDRSYDLFKNISSGSNRTKLNYKVTSSIIEDDQQNLWIATEGGGLNYLDRKSGLFNYYTHNDKDLKSISTDNIKSMIRTTDGYFWIGTHDGGLNFLDPNTRPYNFIKYKNIPDDSTSISNDRIISLYEDYIGDIWIGTSGGGLNVMDHITKKVMRIKGAQSVVGPIIYKISSTYDKNKLLIGGSKGLAKIDIRSHQLIPIKYKQEDQLNGNNLNTVLNVYEDNDRNLWIGTEGDGLYYYNQKSKNSVKYGLSSGLPNEVIYGILPDNFNNLWLSTNNGLSRLNLDSFQFKNFDVSDGLLGNEFNYGSYARFKNGDLAFGGTKGLNYFNPGNLVENSFVPPVLLTEILVNNKPFKGTDNSTDEMRLNYDQNHLNFQFVALSYSQPNKNQFAYKLEGFDKDWTYIGNNRTATYTNLDSGEYIFKVKASNSDGLWNEKGTSIKIQIRPAPWLTWWAYLIYFILLVTLVLGIRRYNLIRIREKNELKKERIEKERLEEINQLKLQLFTNISHDFRTPLTLIIGPLERMLKNNTGDDFIQRQHEIMHRNASVLLQLINQLLDFRKSESGKISLQASKNNIVPFIENIKLSFEELAYARKIKYSFNYRGDDIEVWFDKLQLKKIIYNLLSNAFKFTPDAGEIKITVDTVTKRKRRGNPKEFVKIVVKDNGKGVPKQNLKFIFDRFFQLGQDENTRSGTGIGLALTKSLVELHHGTIKAKSKEGQGTSFVVLLPIGKNHLNDNEILTNSEKEIENSSIFPGYISGYPSHPIEEKITAEQEIDQVDPSRPNILLVEDNIEMRSFIRSVFETDYIVLEAENGAAAIEISNNQQVDLIISDIMMPVMDGVELCHRIKTNITTSHIPVLLLTAKTSDEAKNTGFTTGADAYITKPFNANILKLRVNNILNSRKSLIEKYKKDLILTPKELTATSPDELFLQKAIDLVEANMSNHQFTVNDFISEMNMSRSALYRKLKALTNQSITEFIKTIKLKRAGQLILQSQMNISEIAYELGFNDLKHFRKSFKNVFNELPSEYRQNQAATKSNQEV